MTESRDRWNRCQALAAKLKQQSLAQSTPNSQTSNPVPPRQNDTRSDEK